MGGIRERVGVFSWRLQAKQSSPPEGTSAGPPAIQMGPRHQCHGKPPATESEHGFLLSSRGHLVTAGGKICLLPITGLRRLSATTPSGGTASRLHENAQVVGAENVTVTRQRRGGGPARAGSAGPRA